MARYNVGDKVRTTDVWNNGMGILIPKGSIVEIKCDNGEMCLCSIQGEVAWYEYKWLGDVVENGSINSKNKTNADKIRAMSDLELSNFIKSVHNDGTCREYALTHGQSFTDMFGNKGVWSWLQSEAE